MPKPITPLIAADIIIELIDQPNHPFVLIERAHEPFGWAIAGGFVDVGETVEHAAIREAKEETCLDVKLTALLGIYSNPTRDTRGHTVTAVYIAEATGMPMAADDAKNFGIYTLDNLPEVLAFDHAQVLEDYLVFRETGKVTPLRD
ncbi:MAG: NUDIX hydrolase [Methylococcales bacterium]|nr:NUDIX hydrolase [Methylococcales bacterium]